MARNISPFAALTNQEKQIKWMEYQTIRLPYTQVTNTDWDNHHPVQPSQSMVPANHEPASLNAGEEKRIITASDTDPMQYASADRMCMEAKRPIPPPEVFVAPQPKRYQPTSQTSQQMHQAPSSYQQLHQKIQHRQYDAVIERMKQAEKRISNYQSWSK